jgi:hypothetical protein
MQRPVDGPRVARDDELPRAAVWTLGAARSGGWQAQALVSLGCPAWRPSGRKSGRLHDFLRVRAVCLTCGKLAEAFWKDRAFRDGWWIDGRQVPATELRTLLRTQRCHNDERGDAS